MDAPARRNWTLAAEYALLSLAVVALVIGAVMLFSGDVKVLFATP